MLDRSAEYGTHLHSTPAQPFWQLFCNYPSLVRLHIELHTRSKVRKEPWHCTLKRAADGER